MQLPLVDEIREARRLSQESHDASIQVARVDNALLALRLLEQQVAGLEEPEVELPGDELLEHLAERWTNLADLGANGARPSRPLAERIGGRRAQLELAAQVLRPLARQAHERADRLASLQEKQRHLLEDPRYAGELTELAAAGEERARLMEALQPINQRRMLVRPCHDLVTGFAHRLRHEEDLLDGPQASPLLAWRAATLARHALESLQGALRALDLQLRLPRPPSVPDDPTDADPQALRVAVSAVRQGLDELGTALQGEQKALDGEAEELEQRLAHLTGRLLERLG